MSEQTKTVTVYLAIDRKEKYSPDAIFDVADYERNWESYGLIHVATADVTFDLRPYEEILEKQLALLDEEKRQVEAAAYKRTQEIEAAKQSLLSIENKPDRDVGFKQEHASPYGTATDVEDDGIPF